MEERQKNAFFYREIISFRNPDEMFASGSKQRDLSLLPNKAGSVR